MLTPARSTVMPGKKGPVRRRSSPPYAFPRSVFVRYTFLVLPVHLLIGFLVCYGTLYYIAGWYFREEMQVYTRDINPQLNDVVPMLIALFVLRVLKPVRMMLLFFFTEMLVRAEQKILLPIIFGIGRIFKRPPPLAKQPALQ